LLLLAGGRNVSRNCGHSVQRSLLPTLHGHNAKTTTNKQTNKQTIDGRIVLLGLLFNFLTRTNRSLLAHQRNKQETKAMTKYAKTKWQNEESTETERERERGWMMSPEFFSCCVVILLLLLLQLVRPIIIMTT
jgi:hypothetical protein